MKLLVVFLLFIYVFFVGYLATGGVDRFIRKNCSPKGLSLNVPSEPQSPPKKKFFIFSCRSGKDPTDIKNRRSQ